MIPILSQTFLPQFLYLNLTLRFKLHSRKRKYYLLFILQNRAQISFFTNYSLFLRCWLFLLSTHKQPYGQVSQNGFMHYQCVRSIFFWWDTIINVAQSYSLAWGTINNVAQSILAFSVYNPQACGEHPESVGHDKQRCAEHHSH